MYLSLVKMLEKITLEPKPFIPHPINCFGTVQSALSNECCGSIKIGGVWWKARSENIQTFNPGDVIQVTAREGLTLLVTSKVSSSRIQHLSH